MGISDFLRGPGGEYEITRGLGALGGLVYIATSTGLAIYAGANLTEYCLQMPVGLAAIMGATAGAARVKDKSSAEAVAIEKGSKK